MNRVLYSYYIGDPGLGQKRGQDKHWRIHCLLWLLIYSKGAFFADPSHYTLGRNGSCIGDCKTITQGKKKLHEHAKLALRLRRRDCVDELRRIDKAIKMLGANPKNLDQFEGEYKEAW